jgi:hypothetical protein
MTQNVHSLRQINEQFATRPRGNSWALEAGPDPKGAGADNGIPCGAAAVSPLARNSLIYEIIPTPAIDHCLANNKLPLHLMLFIKIFFN